MKQEEFLNYFIRKVMKYTVGYILCNRRQDDNKGKARGYDSV